MDRRLFARQIVAGGCLLGVSSSLIAHPFFPPTDAQGTIASVENVTRWIQNGSLGTIQHVTLTHVYSPEHTSLSALMAMLQKDLAMISNLLGTDVSGFSQTLMKLPPTEFGSYSAQLEQDGVMLTWQGLSRIGREASKPTTQLRLYGSKGMIQKNPDGRGYQLTELQAQRIQTENQLSKVSKHLSRREFFTV